MLTQIVVVELRVTHINAFDVYWCGESIVEAFDDNVRCFHKEPSIDIKLLI